MTYGARKAYQTEDSARGYEERPAYRGYIGRSRLAIERRTIGFLAQTIELGSTVLDCPCGNGRWFESLGRRAGRIIARDISVGMVRAARERTDSIAIPIDVRIGEAEHLDCPNDSVDYTFSFALMKHVPTNIQAEILREFARVSTKGVICSFAVFNPLSRVLWKWKNAPESYPLSRDELRAMAAAAGLKLIRLVKVSQPIVGLEYFALMRRKSTWQ